MVVAGDGRQRVSSRGRQEPVCRVSSGGSSGSGGHPSLIGWAWHSLISNKWEVDCCPNVAAPSASGAWGQELTLQLLGGKESSRRAPSPGGVSHACPMSPQLWLRRWMWACPTGASSTSPSRCEYWALWPSVQQAGAGGCTSLPGPCQAAGKGARRAEGAAIAYLRFCASASRVWLPLLSPFLSSLLNPDLH